MSVIRPRPPTDPIEHHPPAEWIGQRGDGLAESVRRIDAARAGVTAGAAVATGILDGYGTLRAHARRRESPLFAILEVARLVRDSVDRVVVVGDGPDRAVVDLLLATCCHPFHDLLPRYERGGRPRTLTLGSSDDDDRVQGTLDLLASRSGDRLSDAWALIVAGRLDEPRAGGISALLRAPAGGGAGGPAEAAIVAAIAAGPAEASVAHARRCDHAVAIAGAGDAGDACLTALLPAAVAGIDVVRLLEGMAAMERRFQEAALAANPVVTFVAVGRGGDRPAGDSGARRRRLLPPPHWPGLVEWAEVLGAVAARTDEGTPGPGQVTTTIRVDRRRRRPSGPDLPPPSAAPAGGDTIRLPRADEHTLGQLLALLRLAALLERQAG